MKLSNLWAIAMEHWKFKVSNIDPYLRKWSSATAGIQNVLLVHGHTTVDVDATVLWPGRWYRGQGAATPQPDVPSGDRCHEYGNNLITDDIHQPLFENFFRNLFATYPCSCLSTLINILCLGVRLSDSVSQMLLDQSVVWSRKVIWLGNEISV